MAIRPTDLQGAIFQSVQSAQLTQRAEQAPREAQTSAQVAFAAQVETRDETVHAGDDAAHGSRIDPRAQGQGGQGGEPGERRQRTPLEEEIAESGGLDEPHLIDFTA